MTQLPSRERLEYLAQTRTLSAYDFEDVHAMAAFALSVLDAEPVAWLVGERAFKTLYAVGQYASEMRLQVIPLYRGILDAGSKEVTCE